jgi:hypothetical protein
MGLDQYGIIDGRTTHQWRKHNRLQGFMNQLFDIKKPNDKEFNCNPINLDLQDIQNLETANASKSLPACEGFFFGQDLYSDDYDDAEWFKYQHDLTVDFIAKAKEALSAGLTVQYDCWW